MIPSKAGSAEAVPFRCTNIFPAPAGVPRRQPRSRNVCNKCGECYELTSKMKKRHNTTTCLSCGAKDSWSRNTGRPIDEYESHMQRKKLLQSVIVTPKGDVKVCSRCGNTRLLAAMVRNQGFHGYAAICQTCQAKRQKSYRTKNNKEINSKARLAWPKTAKKRKSKRQIDGDRIRALEREHQHRHINEITDAYVRSQLRLRGLPINSVMVDIKRKQIQIKRIIKSQESMANKL